MITKTKIFFFLDIKNNYLFFKEINKKERKERKNKTIINYS